MSYWMQSQIQQKHRASCPRCRNHVDTSNLVAPRGSTEWTDVHEMEWDEESDFDNYGDDSGEEGDDEEPEVRIQQYSLPE